MAAKVDMRTRESAIYRFVKDSGPEGATVREAWEELKDPDKLGDTVTLQAYHRTMDKMAARGRLSVLDDADGGVRRYGIAEYLTADNAYSLTDLEEILVDGASSPEAIAQYLDALDYFESHQRDTLGKAVLGLLEEEPVALVTAMMRDKVDRLQEAVADLNDPETAGREASEEVQRRHRELVTLIHSYYGLSSRDIDLGDVVDVSGGRHKVEPDWDLVRASLGGRVFGERVLYFVDSRSPADEEPRVSFSVGGSDGSSHASFLSGFPGTEFVEDGPGLTLTFSNSLAAVKPTDALAVGLDFPYHAVPMTRAALEDPSNVGMVLARPWHDNLTDSEYEHMKKSALDVVQFRVDERVMSGSARALHSGKLLPRPGVHFRDGTVVPQEREFQHYCRQDQYGDIVREGIALSGSILRSVQSSERLVFAGAVKSTQLRIFAELLDWYIVKGSSDRHILGKLDGHPIDPHWDLSRAGRISDHYAMTRLMAAASGVLSSFESGLRDGRYLCSFAVLRPFPQLLPTWYREKVADTEWGRAFREN